MNKILIIEDNEINCAIIGDILSRHYLLFFAANGKEGMDLMKKHTDISAVLLDLQMPVMNGYEVLECKAADPQLKDIPVIVTTGNEGPDEELRCLKLGAKDFVHKPYNPIVVRLRVQNVIHMHELELLYSGGEFDGLSGR